MRQWKLTEHDLFPHDQVAVSVNNIDVYWLGPHQSGECYKSSFPASSFHINFELKSEEFLYKEHWNKIPGYKEAFASKTEGHSEIECTCDGITLLHFGHKCGR